MMIPVDPNIAIDDNEIQLSFVRSSGPGGQNVNSVSTAVLLRFEVANSPSLPEDVRARLMRLAGRRISQEGILTIKAQRFRTQERNRTDALERLVKLIRQAALQPASRKKTRPSRTAREARISDKKRQSEIKKRRRGFPLED